MRHPFSRLRTSAGLAALAMLAAAPAAHAVVVYSGTVNLAVPNTSAGLYLNVIDGSTYTGPGTFPVLGGPGANYDLNFFGTTAWTAFSPGTSGQSSPTVPTTSRGYVAATTAGAISALAAGTPINGGSTYNTGSPSGADISTGAPVIVGFRFRSENNLSDAADDTVHFGWVRLVLSAGVPGTLIDYAYESTPLTGIVAGAVPEPATYWMMGAGALALLGWSRRRAG